MTHNKFQIENLEHNMIFMYRRPILWTLYGAVDFLKVLKITVVVGGGGGGVNGK